MRIGTQLSKFGVQPGGWPMMPRRRFITGSATSLAFASLGTAPQVLAQVARRPARMLVGFPPGGSADFVARLLLNEMSGYAPSIVVENRPGANGRIALDALKTSAA